MEEKKLFKIFNIISTGIKVICIVILTLLVAILALQRFSNNEKAVGGYRVFNVATGSMVPVYDVGDILIVKEVDTNSLKVGDDVTYKGEIGSFKDKFVTHRIIKIDETIGGKVFHTQGTANDEEDPEILSEQIYGKVIYKCFVLSLLSKLTKNLTAFYIIVFIPLGFLIFLQIKDGIAERKEKNNYDEDEEDEADEDDDDEDDEEDDDE